jgi:hypothetical protein
MGSANRQPLDFPIIGYRLFGSDEYVYRLAERGSNPARDTSRG